MHRQQYDTTHMVRRGNRVREGKQHGIGMDVHIRGLVRLLVDLIFVHSIADEPFLSYTLACI